MSVATTADLAKLARRTRAFVTDPAKHWCIRRDPERDVLQGVRAHAPDALDYFGSPAVLAAALTAGTVCRWCEAFVRAATSGRRPPANEAMLELLGQPCDRCARLILRQITDSLEAAMAVPLDIPSPGQRRCRRAWTVRDREPARAHAATLRGLEQARLSARPHPADMLWPAGNGQPASVTAALQAAGRRKTPGPPYYWPNRRRRLPGGGR